MSVVKVLDPPTVIFGERPNVPPEPTTPGPMT
jgi:hypothetical protein